VRRAADGTATIAVAVKGRPYQAVVADLIEGIVVVNDLDGFEATRLRTALWEEIVATHADAAWRGAA
jgi:3-hydroxyacyl-CoA dehydrogenase